MAFADVGKASDAVVGQVLQARRASLVSTIPSQAAIFNQNGLQAALVPAEGSDVARSIGLDDGASVDIRAGLKHGDHVILSPPANIANGMWVQER